MFSFCCFYMIAIDFEFYAIVSLILLVIVQTLWWTLKKDLGVLESMCFFLTMLFKILIVLVKFLLFFCPVSQSIGERGVLKFSLWIWHFVIFSFMYFETV